jgi:hypothetical protein
MDTTSIQTLLGGQEINVTHLDGTVEAVKVRQLPVKDMPRYMAVFEDVEKSAELFCAKPAGWAETITRESFKEIITVGEGLNLDFLEWHATGAQRRREKVMPGFTEKIMSAAISRLPNGSAALPSNAA